MAPEHDLHKMLGRKLTKKRKPLRASSVQYPARLKEGEDAQEDVTAAKGEPAQHLNQSVFSMIAAAGSKVDFNARFEEEESSDSDDENQASANADGVEEHSSHLQTQTQLDKQHEDGLLRREPSRPQGQLVESRSLRSLPKLDLRTIKERKYMSQSLRLPSSETLSQHDGPTGVTPRNAPVMSMMLEAQAELTPSTPHLDIKNTGVIGESQDVIGKETLTSLGTRLMEIFGFEGPEEVVSGNGNDTIDSCQRADRSTEYPCWLLQSVLLQGYMYITQNHICFYSYLPKKSVSLPHCL